MGTYNYSHPGDIVGRIKQQEERLYPFLLLKSLNLLQKVQGFVYLTAITL